MKALAISYKGIEDIAALEIKEILGAKTYVKQSCVVFDVDDYSSLAKFCYKTQSSNRVLLLLDSFKIKSAEDVARISKIDFDEFIKGHTFAGRCEIVENKNLSSKEIEIAIGDSIEAKVDLKNPFVTVFAYIYKNDCYVGIDLSGDLSKRDYKIYTVRHDIKGTVAYALVRLSSYSPGKIFLDPFSLNGTVAVEAALFGSGLSVNHYNKEKFPFLKFLDIDLKIDSEIKEANIFAFDNHFGFSKATSNNAKIAGVKIDSSQLSVKEIAQKLKSVDCIATNIPRITQFSDRNRIMEDYADFFEQAKAVLNKKGKIAVCCKNAEEIKQTASSKGFSLEEEREIRIGEERLRILIFNKK